MFDNFNVNLRKHEGFPTCIPCIPIPEYGRSNAPQVTWNVRVRSPIRSRRRTVLLWDETYLWNNFALDFVAFAIEIIFRASNCKFELMRIAIPLTVVILHRDRQRLFAETRKFTCLVEAWVDPISSTNLVIEISYKKRKWINEWPKDSRFFSFENSSKLPGARPRRKSKSHTFRAVDTPNTFHACQLADCLFLIGHRWRLALGWHKWQVSCMMIVRKAWDFDLPRELQ